MSCIINLARSSVVKVVVLGSPLLCMLLLTSNGPIRFEYNADNQKVCNVVKLTRSVQFEGKCNTDMEEYPKAAREPPKAPD